MLPWPSCPVGQEEGLWLEQASAGRTLAVPSRGSSGVPAAATLPQSCPEPSGELEAGCPARPCDACLAHQVPGTVAMLLRDERARVRAAAVSWQSAG